MTRYDHVLQILDQAVGGPTAPVDAHGPFWRHLTRNQFVARRVFGRLLVAIGDGKGSNLVKALKGEPPFGADTGSMGAKIRLTDAELVVVLEQAAANLEAGGDKLKPLAHILVLARAESRMVRRVPRLGRIAAA